MKKYLIIFCLLMGLSKSAFAFFNPFSMMGNMMGSMAGPVTSQMIGQMLGVVQNLLHSSQFRHDVSNFALGTADKAIYNMLISLQKNEPTFIGALTENLMTGGAPKGSAEYNQAMGQWMQVFGPAIQAAQNKSQQKSLAKSTPQYACDAEEEVSRQQELGVYSISGEYNWESGETSPNRMVFHSESGTVVDYIPCES